VVRHTTPEPRGKLSVAGASLDDYQIVAKALYAARLLAEGYGKVHTAANMAKAEDAAMRLANRAAQEPSR